MNPHTQAQARAVIGQALTTLHLLRHETSYRWPEDQAAHILRTIQGAGLTVQRAPNAPKPTRLAPSHATPAKPKHWAQFRNRRGAKVWRQIRATRPSRD